ncbi:MAG TPA: iron-containing alcohol dehydrogenase [Bryobacteraceae bacterium]|nr:iron-containing alcohol dehydrogenase [Bryobacteraceae bacterium]
MLLSRFSFPTTILFGPGAIDRLPDELAARGMHRPLLVTDAGLVNTPAAARVRKLIPHAPVFSAVDPNPTEKNVLDGVAFYKEHDCDSIIGLGGGSPIDAAKAIRLKITHPLDLAEYDDNIGGDAKITANLPRYIAIPTTAGTGSEVGRSTVITIAATNRKTVVFSPHLIPDLALADPELTTGMPPKITAGTGMDAFTHNVEAYLSKGFQPICDSIALGGAKIVYDRLPQVMKQPDDIESRGQMMIAAMMGAIAFQKGLGAVHSLAHPLSSEFGMHHGTSNAVLLPAVLEYNRSSVPDRFRDLARDLGKDIAECTRELNEVCGITPRLRDYGIPESALPMLADKAVEDGCHLLNPRPCTREDLLALYKQAW